MLGNHSVNMNGSNGGGRSINGSDGFFITEGDQFSSSITSTKKEKKHATLSPIKKKFTRRFGSTMDEIQKKFDLIMEESDEIVERAEILARSKKATLEAKRKRKEKQGRRSTLASSKAKQDRLEEREKKRELKRKEREKEKKNDKRKRAWSTAGASQKEVIDIISAFQAIDEDLTGEIDPKEFFALPQFSGFGSGSIETLFRAIDKDGSGTVTQNELLTVMFPVATKADIQEMIKMAHKHRYGSGKKEEKKAIISESDRADIETIFNMYDTDNSNTVSLTELLAALGEKLRNIMTSAEIAAIFETFDSDKNAYVHNCCCCL